MRSSSKHWFGSSFRCEFQFTDAFTWAFSWYTCQGLKVVPLHDHNAAPLARHRNVVAPIELGPLGSPCFLQIRIAVLLTCTQVYFLRISGKGSSVVPRLCLVSHRKNGQSRAELKNRCPEIISCLSFLGSRSHDHPESVVASFAQNLFAATSAHHNIQTLQSALETATA